MTFHKNNLVRAFAVVVVIITAGFLSGLSSMGGTATDDRLAELGLSPNWQGGQFRNLDRREDIDLDAAMQSWLGEEPAHSTPVSPVPVIHRKAGDFDTPPKGGLRVTWLGHSSTLVEIDGYRILIDPIWGERASPFGWMGPKRFHEAPMALADLPTLDAIVISHDHYDHLDYGTIKHFVQQRVPFVVPLGLGTHLKYWGVDEDRITELDWWENHQIGALTLTATPARHQSGRTIEASDTWQTLWAGWSIKGDDHSVYYSGDTSMFPAMAEIGQRLGPFDVTLIDSGAYNQLWRDNHLGPEQAVQSHQMVGGKLMVPVHWGTFYLAPHAWTEPVERVVEAAKIAGVQVATPRPGESIEPGAGDLVNRWWPAVPWRTAKEFPIISSGLEGPQAPTPLP
jgi:L-ascorbate metabolism protein UlaG (beta-lactamase superfamily)